MSPAAVSLVYCGRIDTPEWYLGGVLHDHPFVELLVVYAGTLAIRSGGQEVLAHAGDLVYYPADTQHIENVEGPRRPELIYVGIKPPFREVRPLLTHDVAGRVRVLAGWLVEEAAATTRHGTDLTSALLAAILAEHGRCLEAPLTGLADRVRSWMRDHLAEPVALADLARIASLSPAYLIRSFKRATGRTPMEELRHLRLEAARDILVTTALPLKAVASRVGISDEQHLSKMFRRQFGAPPGSYRPRVVPVRDKRRN